MVKLGFYRCPSTLFLSHKVWKIYLKNLLHLQHLRHIPRQPLKAIKTLLIQEHDNKNIICVSTFYDDEELEIDTQ